VIDVFVSGTEPEVGVREEATKKRLAVKVMVMMIRPLLEEGRRRVSCARK